MNKKLTPIVKLLAQRNALLAVKSRRYLSYIRWEGGIFCSLCTLRFSLSPFYAE
jgi:hypothetical protein